jgi:hypothetical protein
VRFRAAGSFFTASLLACGIAGLCSSATPSFADAAAGSSPLPAQIRTIVLERGGCKACPHYSITLSSDGRTKFHGISGVDMIGDYSSAVDFWDLADWIEAQKFDALAGVYGNSSANGPSMKLTIERNRSTAVIEARDANAAPLAAFGAAAAIDGYVEEPWWRPAGPLDSYVGWFLDDSRPGVLRRLDIYPLGVAVAHVDPVAERSDPCSSDGVAVVSVGGYDVVVDLETRSAQLRTFDQPPALIPLELRSDTLVISSGDAAGTYRRVTERDVDEALESLAGSAKSQPPTCVSTPPEASTAPAPLSATRTPTRAGVQAPITSVTLTRSFCVVGCSAFTVTYRNDDTATFSGTLHVDPLGNSVGQVDFQRIASWLDSQGIDRFDGRFGTRVLDGRTTSLRVVRSDRTIDFEFSGGGDFPPDTLWIVTALEGYARQVQWRPSSELDRVNGYYLAGASGVGLETAYVNGDDPRFRYGSISVRSQDRCADGGMREVFKDFALRIRDGALQGIWTADEVHAQHLGAWAASTSDDDSYGRRMDVMTSPTGLVVVDGKERIALRHASMATARGTIDLYRERYGAHGAPRPSDCPAPSSH